jgi:hypothetical protein
MRWADQPARSPLLSAGLWVAAAEPLDEGVSLYESVTNLVGRSGDAFQRLAEPIDGVLEAFHAKHTPSCLQFEFRAGGNDPCDRTHLQPYLSLAFTESISQHTEFIGFPREIDLATADVDLHGGSFAIAAA